MRARPLAILLILLACIIGSARAHAGVVDVTVRPGVTVRYLALEQRPTGKPRIAVILFAGGDGLLKLTSLGGIPTGLKGNFLVRSRGHFVKRGLFVAVVDAPNQVAISGNERLSWQYAVDMAHVIADVRGRARAGKVWLIGTSTGTLSAVGIASQTLVRPFPPPVPGRPDGIVLASTQNTAVSGFCNRTVFDANLAAVSVPSFLVAHRDDGCACSPPRRTFAVLSALTHAPAKASQIFTGGTPPTQTDPCMAFTRHGFIGIEGSVVTAIANWIRMH